MMRQPPLFIDLPHFSNEKVPERNPVFMVLEHQMSFRIDTETFGFGEFTRGDAVFPFLRCRVDFQHFSAVEPMFDSVAHDHDSAFVPFACGFQVLRRLRLLDMVKRRRGAVRELAFRIVWVVQNLVFRTKPAVGVVDVDLAADFTEVDKTVLHAAVAALGDLPFEVEDEILELFFRSDIVLLSVFAMENAVFDLPVAPDGPAARRRPALQRVALEQGNRRHHMIAH